MVGDGRLACVWREVLGIEPLTRDRFFAEASDDTDSATVIFMQPETHGFLEASGGGRYDLWLAPLLEGHAAADLLNALRPFCGRRRRPLLRHESRAVVTPRRGQRTEDTARARRTQRPHGVAAR